MTENERIEEIVQRVIVYRRAMVGAFDNSDQPGTYTADVSWLLSVIAERDRWRLSALLFVARVRRVGARLAATPSLVTLLDLVV